MLSGGLALSESSPDDDCRFSRPAASQALPAAGHETAALDVPTLTQRMRGGDERAFTEFHARYYRRLYGYAFVLCGGSEQDSAEVAQETLLRVVRYVKRMPNESVLWSWLTVLIRSAAADHGRRKSRYRVLLDRVRLTIDLSRAADGACDTRTDLLNLLDEAMRSLTEDERMLVQRKYFSRETCRHIARDLKLSERAVEGRLTRAREKLRRWILQRRKAK